ncbi:MAG TPA: bifunctional (p)ppGpp synthetase/guanosine-3',5'-bis(diphosphate) 3'-pyrophosphohydrolase [Thermoanaerobaculia bacterium]|jgi:GTP pyrophosphokinase|nr:bifunctional (p)ppGpp synthetase/guanosine-3',5'-bis(diphosphate) 3'-pyrophosphohydrolase [Thermoanaerobaculia bacterium]
MIRFEDILDKVEGYKPDFDEELLQKAYIFSAREHRDQVRSSGEPYLVHPLNVAYTLADMHLDETSIAVGLLHDVLEDTLTTKEKLEEMFGEDVADLVDGVTKISRYAYVSKEEQQAETFRKMLLAMVSDLRVVLVKLADRLHNMRTLQYLPEERRIAIAKETMEIYAPIANRLGMGRIKHELEDLSFRHLHPHEYEDLSKAVSDKMAVSGEVVDRIKATLAKKLKDNEIEGEVTGRVKSMFSIWTKLQKQEIDIGQLYDYLAFRIITPTLRDCYACLGIIHQMWRPVPGRIKDYIAMPKPNFYQSLHTTVVAERGQPFEVQIRTKDMDLVAEQGIAAHWKYKEGRVGASHDDANFLWLRQLVEWQHDIKDPRVFMNSLKIDLYPDEVYTFTPKGDVFAFPRGATPLDFAYRIHTDVGHRCVGARVNGKLVPLRTPLKNGDIVEIMTGTTQTPSREWVNMVVTSRARHKIRHWLNLEQKNRSIELGRKLIEKEAKKYKVPWRKLVAENALDGVLHEYGLSRLDDLYADLGYGKVSPRSLVERFVTDEQKEKGPVDQGVLGAAVRKIFPFTASPAAIKVKGYDDLMTYLAKCCKPLPGEKIVGYVTRGKGVAVHSANCPNVKNLMFNPDREIAVEWADQRQSNFNVELEILMEDRQGILARVVSTIANLKTNIRQMESRTVDGRAMTELVLEIADLKHLEKVTRSLSNVDGVMRVDRKYNIRHATA